MQPMTIVSGSELPNHVHGYRIPAAPPRPLTFVFALFVISAAIGSYLGPASIGVPTQLSAFRLLSSAVVVWAVLSKGPRTPIARVERAFFVFVLMFLGWGLVSLLWTPDLESGASEYLSAALSLAAAAAAVRLIRRHPMLITVFARAWAFGFAATAAVAAWEVGSRTHLPGSFYTAALPYLGTRQEFEWVASTFNNPNDYAAYLLVSMPIVLFALRPAKAAVLRATFVALWAFLLWKAESRTGILGGVILVAVWLALASGSRAATRSRKFRVIVVATCLALALAAGLLIFLGELAPQLGLHIAPSDQGRVDLSLFTLTEAIDSGGLGRGAGSIEILAAQSSEGWQGSAFSNPHNMGLEVLAQYGIIVFGALVWTASTLLFASVRLRRSTSEFDVQASRVIITGLAALAAWSLASSSTLQSQPFWLALAYFVALGAQCTRPLSPATPGRPTPGSAAREPTGSAHHRLSGRHRG